jgi:hypothetical protein
MRRAIGARTPSVEVAALGRVHQYIQLDTDVQCVEPRPFVARCLAIGYGKNVGLSAAVRTRRRNQTNTLPNTLHNHTGSSWSETVRTDRRLQHVCLRIPSTCTTQPELRGHLLDLFLAHGPPRPSLPKCGSESHPLALFMPPLVAL